MPLTLTPLKNIPLIHHGDDLADILLKARTATGLNLLSGDIVVLAQKIVSKAEGRLVNLSDIKPSPEAKKLATRSDKDSRLCQLILQESKKVLRVKPGTIVVEHRLGFICANAGIDHSNVKPPPGSDAHRMTKTENAEDWVLLLPEHPDRSAGNIRAALEKYSGASLGVLIIDSHGRAWRNGTVGTTIGLSGMPGLVDLRGQPDLFGFRLRITQVGAADELAAAASLVMGQAAEATPAVHARGFPYPLRDGRLDELLRPEAQDLFR